MTRFLNWLRGLWARRSDGRTPGESIDEFLRARRQSTTVPERSEERFGCCLLVLVFGGIVVFALIFLGIVLSDWVKELL